MLVAAAVCPCPPLLVPEVAAGAAPEMDDARAACYDALALLAAARPDRLVVVGADGTAPDRETYPQGAPGSFRGFGVDLAVTLGAANGRGGAEARELPQSLAVGAWLLARVRWHSAPVTGLGVAESLSRSRCVRTGREVAASAPRVALLVMGDGSACRTLKAPGYFDPRAAAFDAAVARALGTADAPGLLELDEKLSSELQAAGRPGWQVLAGAAEEAGLGGRLLYDAAPYGVGYLVAGWS